MTKTYFKDILLTCSAGEGSAQMHVPGLSVNCSLLLSWKEKERLSYVTCAGKMSHNYHIFKNELFLFNFPIPR